MAKRAEKAFPWSLLKTEVQYKCLKFPIMVCKGIKDHKYFCNKICYRLVHTYWQLDENGKVKSAQQHPQLSSENKTGHLQFCNGEGYSCASNVLLFRQCRQGAWETGRCKFMQV